MMSGAGKPLAAMLDFVARRTWILFVAVASTWLAVTV